MLVIAIDGPAGAGKSTIGRALAARLGLEYLDTGAMYRAVAVAAIDRGLDGDDPHVGPMCRAMDLQVGDRVVLDGVDVTKGIRTAEVTAAVSLVAANSEVRAELRGRQRAWAHQHGGGVIEGRDIGSVVFPDARLKLYLTASPRIRAQRRVAEAGGEVAQIEAAIAVRDMADASRHDGPLAQADGAVVVDTTELTIDEVLTEIVGLLMAADTGTHTGTDTGTDEMDTIEHNQR